MRLEGLVGVHARRRWRTGRPDVAPAPDLVNRDFTPRGPDHVWAADVTQFHTGEGWLHLAGVIDLWSRRVVGWAMGSAPTSELVGDALLMAFQRRRPDRRVVHHSDRGAAYTSLAFSQRVAELELDQSFGSTGDCYDNAVVEAFWATLKRELAWIHGTTDWRTRSELRSAVFDYIEGFYNPSRIQRRLGSQSPADYEKTRDWLETTCPPNRVNTKARAQRISALLQRPEPGSTGHGGAALRRLCSPFGTMMMMNGDRSPRQGASGDLEDVPHGQCVDCGAKTYLWCEIRNDWHCTSCDADCP